MFKRLILLTFSLIVLNFYSSNSIANECDGSPWNKTILDNKDKHYEFSFLEERNDSGIFLHSVSVHCNGYVKPHQMIICIYLICK